ncbi:MULTISPECIES: hypothetical protein [unclassified Rhizobacter]|uniref:hypothetical protein n=1 Tax=unclassified Rhizobacter TaxID=2640088 RepID=UPI00070FF221|nr:MULTISPECIES: hypothetical protein [unclassified Rhizobacter]KQU81421.1 hypothetical protein ASC88_00625 [Rhizobacter sp. Root29]
MQTLLDEFSRRIGSSPFDVVADQARFVCNERFTVDLFLDTRHECLRIGTQVGHSLVAAPGHEGYWNCLSRAQQQDPRFEVSWNAYTGEMLSMSAMPMTGLDIEVFMVWVERFLERSTDVADAWLAVDNPRSGGLPLADCRSFA